MSSTPTWIGYGLWTQLWGSWALPFAWALSWRAMADRRFLAPAAVLVALTTACHYETGYLAFGAVVVMPFLVWAGLPARLMRLPGCWSRPCWPAPGLCCRCCCFPGGLGSTRRWPGRRW